MHTNVHGPLSASLGLSVSLCASVALWASLGLSGPLWASLGHSTKDKTMHNRQLDPQFSLGFEVARRQDHKTHTQQLETQCSSKPSGRQPASQPPSQPAKRMTALFYPRSATLGLPTYTCTIGSLCLSGPLCASLCLSDALWATYTHSCTQTYIHTGPQKPIAPGVKMRMFAVLDGACPGLENTRGFLTKRYIKCGK